jgi:integrase
VQGERERGIVVQHIFIYENGQPIRSPRKSWLMATEAAGLPGLLVHDLRRSGVMAMIRAGIPQVTAMKLSGHRSDSVFRRFFNDSATTEIYTKSHTLSLHDADPKTPERKVVGHDA